MRTKKLFVAGLACFSFLNVFAQTTTWNYNGNAISSGTWLGTTNDNDFIIKTGTTSTERLRIVGSTGVVGIGMTPIASYKVSIGGFLRVGAGSSSGGIDIKPSGTSTIDILSGTDVVTAIDFKGFTHGPQDFWGRIKYTDGTGFTIQTGGTATDRVIVTETGTVGIGITPAANMQLHVEGLGTKFSSGTSYIGFSHGSAQIDLAGTNPTIDFKGTSHLAIDYWGRIMYTDGTGFDFLTANSGIPKIRLKEDGKLILGDPSVVQTVTPPTLDEYKLFVDGGIIAEKVKVALCCGVDWADYVFAPDYQLLSIDSVDTYIQQNQHLPGVPSSEEVQENGIEVAQMDALLLQKIEELTLYIIELKKEIEILKDEKKD